MEHDYRYKELVILFLKEFVQLFLPKLARCIDFSSVQFMDKEIFTDLTGGRRKVLDIVVKVKMRGQEVFFLIHIEHQSSSQKDFPKRMFRYYAVLLERYDLPIYPIVLFSHDQPRRPEADRYQIRFPDKLVLDFSYAVIQLNQMNWRDFIRRKNPVASALMAKMKIAPRDRPRVKLECLRMLATMKLDPARMHFIGAFVDSYLPLDAREQLEFEKELSAEAPKQREAVMQLMTSWEREGIKKGRKEGRQEGLQEGRQEGLQEGRQEGRQEGQAEIVLRQLHRRLGPPASRLEQRVRVLSVSRLGELADALLDFTELAQAEAWLAEHA